MSEESEELKVVLDNANFLLNKSLERNKDLTERINEAIEYIKEIIKNIKEKSEKILDGEYYVIHSDYIIALEEEIEKLNTNITLEIKIDGKKMLEILGDKE